MRYELTSNVKLLTLDVWSLLVRALNKLVHGNNRCLVTGVNLDQDTLKRLVQVQLSICLLLALCSSKSEELGDGKKSSIALLLCLLSNLGLSLGNCLLKLLVVLVGKILLDTSDLSISASLSLLIELLVVLDLLLVLSERSLERRLVQDLSLLIWVDLLGGDKIVECLAWVLLENVINLRSVGLDGRLVCSLKGWMFMSSLQSSS